MHVTNDSTKAQLTFTHNRFYDPDDTAMVYWGTSGEVSPDTVGSNNSVGDPGLTNPAGGDFTIAVGAAVIDAGVDMGSGAIDTITIQGTAYTVDWDVGLGPTTSRTVGCHLTSRESARRTTNGCRAGASPRRRARGSYSGDHTRSAWEG